MGIPAEALLCYVQLGAGKINDIDSELSIVLEALSKHPQVYSVVGESMLGERISSEFERVRVLRDYPNSRYFEDFDFAVMAGGYNSFHEAIQASLPTICLPNMKTGRTTNLLGHLQQRKQVLVVIKDKNRKIIQAAVDQLLEK